ncbi:MAG TPA: glycosyltransferase family 87 protein [Cyclobacteriaceae bacterium]|nr:glycosyltransferase family 87 protein [Cyclobacteriaceae bacterium]
MKLSWPTWLWEKYTPVFAVYMLAIILVTLQSYLLPLQSYGTEGFLYTHYNNYIIFKQSFFHLIQHKNLYHWYEPEQWDLFKYSPSFALLFGVFAYLPDPVGLLIWNILNVGCLIVALVQVPRLPDRARVIMLFFILVEVVISIQSTQSNALIAGLLVLAFIAMERNRPMLAAVLITSTVFIKLFGLFGFGLFLFYPCRWKGAMAAAMSMILFAFLPLIVLSWSELMMQYQGWYDTLAEDRVETGLSVLGWFQSWFGLNANPNTVVLIGFLMLLVPLLRWRCWIYYPFRLMALASVLIWVVIFNHMAESPTFVIAVTGAGIWFFARSRPGYQQFWLWFILLFTSLSTTDLFPKDFQLSVVEPFVLKAVPCIALWVWITIEMLIYRPERKTEPTTA